MLSKLVGSHLRAIILPIAFSLSLSLSICDIPCDAFVTNIGLCVIICQALCDLCLDILVV